MSFFRLFFFRKLNRILGKKDMFGLSRDMWSFIFLDPRANEPVANMPVKAIVFILFMRHPLLFEEMHLEKTSFLPPFIGLFQSGIVLEAPQQATETGRFWSDRACQRRDRGPFCGQRPFMPY